VSIFRTADSDEVDSDVSRVSASREIWEAAGARDGSEGTEEKSTSRQVDAVRCRGREEERTDARWEASAGIRGGGGERQRGIRRERTGREGGSEATRFRRGGREEYSSELGVDSCRRCRSDSRCERRGPGGSISRWGGGRGERSPREREEAERADGSARESERSSLK
jgi:hypothetical protein